MSQASWNQALIECWLYVFPAEAIKAKYSVLTYADLYQV